MNFEHTEDRRMLADTLDRFLSEQYPIETRHAAAKSDTGYSSAVWNGLAELGAVGALFPEDLGGFGGDAFDVTVVFESLGKGLAIEPFLGALVVGRAIAAAGSAAQKEQLAGLLHGSTVAALAHDETGGHHELSHVALTATRQGDTYVLNGRKGVVVFGETAQLLLVSARCAGGVDDEAGISLFLVPADAAGLSAQGYPRVDGGRVADLVFTQVQLPASALLGAEGQGFEVLEEAAAWGRLALCAEAVGAMDVIKALTLEYLRTRKQFGVPIGSFQALQHRMADVLLEIEQARSAVINAAAAMGADRLTRERAVSAAKYSIGRIGTRVAEECIQLHGGIGMTWELPMAHYAKRLVMIDHQLGDEDHHLARYMALARLPVHAAHCHDMPRTVITDETPFLTITGLVREHAHERPLDEALCDEQQTLSWRALDALMDRVAAAFQRDGLRPGEAIAICAASSVRYAALFLGALRAGLVVAPLAPSVTRESLAQMLDDAQARCVFADAGSRELLPAGTPVVWIDGSGGPSFDGWLAPEGSRPQAVDLPPEAPFNIIYSSGTTGTPKGIVQSHGMRWQHVCRGARYGYSTRTKTLLSTPLYSNTTLVVFFPTLAFGGCVHLMPKFDAVRYLGLAEQRHITHAMLVPVQYQRLMAVPDFGRFDLSAFQMKFCTSAPFSAALKADVLARWPGGLVEFYGMTEGGGTCILNAHEHPDKLHTVGQPAPGHDIRLINEDGRELPPGETGAVGEVVGHSAAMMAGYHRQPGKTREVEWFDASGQRFIRTGDVGRFDADGFLVLMDRRKDMIISGGFNLYPSDLEALLRQHPAVEDVAVIGVPSEQWGETPVAFVVRRAGDATDEATLTTWHNERSGKTQRLAALQFIHELPRSAIGKVLKRELRERLNTPVR